MMMIDDDAYVSATLRVRNDARRITVHRQHRRKCLPENSNTLSSRATCLCGLDHAYPKWRAKKHPRITKKPPKERTRLVCMNPRRLLKEGRMG
mmetsp:Transcript_293/g.534  ORF Transcript_293/g.534 Transcript_293/m.534 type:complete len:93 (+) Transcript_293:112-390(+)